MESLVSNLLGGLGLQNSEATTTKGYFLVFKREKRAKNKLIFS